MIDVKRYNKAYIYSRTLIKLKGPEVLNVFAVHAHSIYLQPPSVNRGLYTYTKTGRAWTVVHLKVVEIK